MGRYVSKPVKYSGLFRCLEPVTFTTPWSYMADAQRAQGFNGDGDYFVFASATTLQYYNSSDVLQFTITAGTDINANATHYCGFTYDPVDDLVYGVAQRSDSPYTMYLFSVNSSGTVVNIGNDDPSGSTQYNGFKSPDEADASCVQRQVDGSGAVLVQRGGTTSSSSQISLAIADGTLTETSGFNPGYASPGPGADGSYSGVTFITKSGYAIRGFIFPERDSTEDWFDHSVFMVQVWDTANTNKEVAFLSLPVETLGLGVPYQTNTLTHSFNGLTLTNWNGNVIPFWGDGSDHINPVAWDQDEFDLWVQDLLKFAGLSL